MIQDMINSETIWIQLNRQTQTYSREVILDKAMELVQKQLSAICLDFQSMVDIVFVQLC